MDFREERLERNDRAADMRNLRIWDGKHIEVKLKEIIPQVSTNTCLHKYSFKYIFKYIYKYTYL